jgi:uncharacterized membrane protein
VNNETARIESFSDGVFAVAITLLIFQIRVPAQAPPGGLRTALIHLEPSYVAFLASFMTIGVMWLNHHRLFSLIVEKDDALIVFNLLLLLVITWLPFPTALIAEHLRGPHADQQTAAVVYASSLLVMSIVFNVMWRYAVGIKAVVDHSITDGVTRQYAVGPAMYGVLLVIAFFNADWCLTLSAVYALYFALPPSLWKRGARSAGRRSKRTA